MNWIVVREDGMSRVGMRLIIQTPRGVMLAVLVEPKRIDPATLLASLNGAVT